MILFKSSLHLKQGFEGAYFKMMTDVNTEVKKAAELGVNGLIW